MGSFLNVVILRLEKGEGGILTGRSKCPKCGKVLNWYELIPLLSFIFLGAKCRKCHKSISIQYPLVELLTAFLFALLFWKFGLSWRLFFLYPLFSILLILLVSDLRTMLIPDIVACIGIGLSLIFLLSTNYKLLPNFLLAVVILGGFFALLVLVSREKWMGRGDILIGVLIGLILGYPNVLVALFLSFILGAAVGATLLLFKLKKFQSQVPFGPFLIFATFVTIFWGEKIINWYLGIIN